MDLERPSVRMFLLLAAVVLPALAVLAALFVFASPWVEQVGGGTALLVVGLGSLLWAALVAITGSRWLTRDLQDVVSLAERGGAPAASTETEPEGELSRAQRRLKSALDERDRQIGVLSAEVATSPLGEGPAEVAARVVRVTRDVTRDPTWQLVVLQALDPELLPAGVYDDDPKTAPRALGELERWAAVAEDGGNAGPRQLEGPWGAVLAVDASSGDALKALLLAPREGRAAPSPAERDLLSLVAQIAGSAIEHALLYARLQVQTDELNRMAAVQSDFLRGVTHDLQTPLTSIRAVAAELGEEGGLSEGARRDLQTIVHQSERLRRMVGQLLAVSRLEAGALESRQEIFRAEPIVERAWAALRDAEHRFTFTTGGTPHLVVGDPDRFEQVLWALLDNAVKYAPPGTAIEVQLDGRLDDAGTLQSDLTVTDAGPGMSPEDQAHAFEQFYRGEGARRLVPDGSGIGLYAARGLIEAMGGRLTLDSRPGAGSTFRITLPAEPTEPEAEPLQS